VLNVQDVRASGDLPRPLERSAAAVAARLRGPGGYYNVGNVIGLSVSLGLQLVSVPEGSVRTIADILYGYLVGSPSAGAFTASMVVFVVSGEMYHRAWRSGSPPDQSLNRLADILSAAGALLLAISLIYIGQWQLAVAYGLLMVAGKLGTAILGDNSVGPPLWHAAWPDPFRIIVLVARLPAVMAPVADLVRQLTGASDNLSLVLLIQPAVLILCQLLWVKADLLLLSAARSQRA
jgi:hypothetical protein